MRFFFLPIICLVLSCSGQKSDQKKQGDNQITPEEIIVNSPKSVVSSIDKAHAIVIILTKDDKIYMQLGDSTNKNDILNTLNKNKHLRLNNTEIIKLMNLDSVGIPFSKMKDILSQNLPIREQQMPGIPCTSDKNELTDWLRAVVEVSGLDALEKTGLFVKGNANFRYPTFKFVKKSFKENNIFKFRIVTTEY